MAALNLKARYYGENEDQHYDSSMSKPEEEDENFWRLFLILEDYLRLDSLTTVDDAIDCALDLYDDAVPQPIGLYEPSPTKNWLYRSNLLAIDLSLQIPFGHPAHFKLAHYLTAMGKSKKLATRIQWKAHKPEDVTRMYNQKLKENFADGYFNVESYEEEEEGEDVMEYVNGQAFLAVFHSTGGHCYTHSIVCDPMYDAFEEDTSRLSWEAYEACVMGAAQHIKYTVKEAWNMVQKPGEAGSVGNEPRGLGSLFGFWLRDKHRKKVEKRDFVEWPFDLKQWRKFRNGFQTVADDEGYSELCRSIAGEAADLMGLQDKAWFEEQRVGRVDDESLREKV